MKPGRGRPPKAMSVKKTKDLRIPVSEDEKKMVAQAMMASNQDMATWARPIILREAQALIVATENIRKHRKK